MKLLENQVAIVTGATAGIGRSIALKFAEHGARVAVFGTNTQRGDAVVEEIIALTGNNDAASFFQVDIACTSDVELSIKQVIEKFATVDILVNNAGVTKDQLLLRMTEQDWDIVMDINVKSCYNTTKALARHMMKAKKGVVVNISSIVGLTGNVGQANYAASKAAIIGFTKSVAKELASRNIRANVICPGYIETKMTDGLKDDQKQMLLEKIPLNRLGQPEDVSNLALFLASPLSCYITGQVITVDGGMVI